VVSNEVFRACCSHALQDVQGLVLVQHLLLRVTHVQDLVDAPVVHELLGHNSDFRVDVDLRAGGELTVSVSNFEVLEVLSMVSPYLQVFQEAVFHDRLIRGVEQGKHREVLGLETILVRVLFNHADRDWLGLVLLPRQVVLNRLGRVLRRH